MRDMLSELARLSTRNARLGRAVVTSVWGSAPRPEGACMLGAEDGTFAGSISGGCVENAVLEEIGRAIKSGDSRLIRFGVTDERAWEVGLACGGTIEVFVEPSIRHEIIAAATREGGSVVATVLEGAGSVGRSVVIREDGAVTTPGDLAWLADQIHGAALESLRTEKSRTVELALPEGGTAKVFLEVFARRPKLVIFGAGQIAMALVPLAKAVGFQTIVADARETFLTRERFPEADELVLDWPEAAFARTGIDRATYICVLSHDPKFDDPALEIGLRSPARYIGAIGSRKTQEKRRAHLRNAGFGDAEIERIHGPIGLDLGGRSPAEVALAIVAEMIAVRYGRSTVDGR
ncbi:MAG TPA: XdhC/CoxI family protein [Gemmatimonadales bacterium]|nr:XdhC/CoxI family protein [Gemmatimonadales bacterium]